MDPTVCTRGKAASWRMGWPIMSIRGRHTDGGSLLLCAALIKLEDNYRFGLKKIRRWSVRRQNKWLHLCLSVFSLTRYMKSPLPSSLLCRLSNQTGQCVFIWVGGRVSAPFIMSSGTMTALLFPAWPTLSQPPDSSRLAFSPLSPGPPLLSPPAFLSSSPRGPTENTAQIQASEPQSQP